MDTKMGSEGGAREGRGGTTKAARPRARGEGSPGSAEPQLTEAADVQPFLRSQLDVSPSPKRRRASKVRSARELSRRVARLGLTFAVPDATMALAVQQVDPSAAAPLAEMPKEIREGVEVLRPAVRRIHGTKFSLAYFQRSALVAPSADKFGYLSSAAIRRSTRLPFDAATRALLDELGGLMADPGREPSADSLLPAGYTYVGQFVDHDIALDVSSSLDVATDARTIHNLRSPALDLDSVYGRGPVLDPHLYVFPPAGNATAIKLAVGRNEDVGRGGPGGAAGAAGMVTKADFDVPRMPAPAHCAVLGDPRNDENLLVAQLHHAMLRFHNAVVEILLASGFDGDVFVEAKKLVTYHYQFAVVNDFMARICGRAVVARALANVSCAVNSPFRMPVEHAVAAYRFGHSMVRDRYWVNFNFPAATLGQIFEASRPPRLPVFSNWVVDFNAFFETGIAVPVNNKARKIDSVLANGLESLPGFSGMMAVLAIRNLRRGLALGLPSGQGMARELGVTPLTATELTAGLPPAELAVLGRHGRLLLTKTPLWYYVLREAAVRQRGDRLGPVGATIVAETLVRILKRDGGSYLNTVGGFVPSLPARKAGRFTFADLLVLAGVT